MKTLERGFFALFPVKMPTPLAPPPAITVRISLTLDPFCLFCLHLNGIGQYGLFCLWFLSLYVLLGPILVVCRFYC